MRFVVYVAIEVRWVMLRFHRLASGFRCQPSAAPVLLINLRFLDISAQAEGKRKSVIPFGCVPCSESWDPASVGPDSMSFSGLEVLQHAWNQSSVFRKVIFQVNHV